MEDQACCRDATAPFRDEQFHEFGLSVVHMAPWRRWKATWNEQKNFEDKIGAGLANLEKHCSQVPADVCRMLFLQLSVSVSLPRLRQMGQGIL
jgi:hypothetical protein